MKDSTKIGRPLLAAVSMNGLMSFGVLVGVEGVWNNVDLMRGPPSTRVCQVLLRSLYSLAHQAQLQQCLGNATEHSDWNNSYQEGGGGGGGGGEWGRLTFNGVGLPIMLSPGTTSLRPMKEYCYSARDTKHFISFTCGFKRYLAICN